MPTTTNHMADVVNESRVLDIHEQAQRMTHDLVRGVNKRQLADPTPCADWDVRTLISHLCQINRQYAAMGNGEQMPDPGTDWIGKESDHVAAHRSAQMAAREVFTRPGMLERMLDSPWGPIPGSVLVQHCVNELIAHGWDLARATGRSTDILPDIAAESERIWRAWFDGDVGRNDQMFEPENEPPPGASNADKMAAYLGRRV